MSDQSAARPRSGLLRWALWGAALIGVAAVIYIIAQASTKPLAPAVRAARISIGLAPQELALYPDLTARENLAFFGKLYGMNGTGLARRVEGVLTAIGLTDRADDRVATYSGGMQRRLNFGASVVHRPRIVFLDEPMSGLDPVGRREIRDLIASLRHKGTTVFFGSHILADKEHVEIGAVDTTQIS